MPGTVLLLAASPLGRGRLVDAASVLPVLAAVPPAVLSGTDTANVVELADPLEPQAVLTRLRAAAAAPGPLTVYAAGELRLDRRQRLPHLALARTTPATVRYTALPWHWFRDELRLRPAGATTLFLDLHADADTWQALCAPPAPGRPFLLDCGRDAAVYGRIAPPPSRRGSGGAVVHEGAGDGAAQRAAAGGGGPAPAGPGPDRAGERGHRPGAGAARSAAGRPARGRHRRRARRTARRGGRAGRAAGAGGGVRARAGVRGGAALDRGPGGPGDAGGDAVRSCQAWMALAGTRLAAGQPADAPAVEAAVDRAHHQWGLVDDPVRVRELGLTLVELRGRVPGRRDGAAEHVRRRLRAVQASVGVPAGQLRTDPPQGATAVP